MCVCVCVRVRACVRACVCVFVRARVRACARAYGLSPSIEERGGGSRAHTGFLERVHANRGPKRWEMN